jgi:hypothetical protein
VTIAHPKRRQHQTPFQFLIGFVDFFSFLPPSLFSSLSLLSFRVIFISGSLYAFELMAEELARHNKMSSTIGQQLCARCDGVERSDGNQLMLYGSNIYFDVHFLRVFMFIFPIAMETRVFRRMLCPPFSSI